MVDLSSLQKSWKTMFTTTLPQAAKSKSPSQHKWPVTLDHCFARIILDNVVADGRSSWDKVIGKPAIRNMDELQLQRAVELGQKILDGKVDLCELDRQSLQARGKNEAKYAGKKRQSTLKLDKGIKEEADAEKPRKRVKMDSEAEPKQLPSPELEPEIRNREEGELLVKGTSNKLLRQTFDRIQSSTITNYRKSLYICLLSVPSGRYTTYQAMSDFLSSAARAVGNGMRNNPFQPDVPCHRVLASDGSIGGFGGEWLRKGKEKKGAKQDNGDQQDETGMRTAKKIKMLEDEGVKFDSAGKVKGPVFREFWDEERFRQEFDRIKDVSERDKSTGAA